MIPNDPMSQEIFASPSYPYFENETPVKQKHTKTKSPDLFSFDPSEGQKGQHIIAKLPSLENLEKEKQAIENLVGFVSSLKSAEVKNIQDKVNEICDGLMGRIVNNLQIENKLEALVIEGIFLGNNPIAEATLVGVNMTSRSLVAFAAGALLAKIKETVAAKEASLANLTNDAEKQKLEKEIKLLKNWVELQSEAFNNLIKDVFVNSIFSAPKAGSAIMTLAHATEAVTSVAQFTFLGIEVISCALSLYSVDTNLDKHELWVKTIAPKNSGNSQAQVKNILDKHIALRDENEPMRKELVESIVKELKDLDSSDEAFEQAVRKLKSAGITLPEKIGTNDPAENIENLIEYIENPDNAARLNQMMIREKQTLSVSTRNALKRMNDKKIEIDRGFLNFDLYKSVILFSVTAVISTLTVILEVLALVGIAAASFAVVGTVLGYGMLALVFGFMLFGAIYYYVKKPNVFKTYLYGVQSQLSFWKIPLAIQNYRKNYTLMEGIQVSHSINELANRVLELKKINDKPEDHLSYFNTHTEEIKHILANGTLDGMAVHKKYFKTKSLVGVRSNKVLTDGDISHILLAYTRELRNQEEAKILEVESYVVKLTELGKSIQYFEQQIKPLQAQVDEARWKDFIHNLGDDSQPNETENIEEGVIPLQTIKTKTSQDVEIIAEYLVKGAASPDNETKTLLQNMDIDFNISPRKAKKAIKSIAKQLRLFFSMGYEETLSMLEK